MKLYEIANQFKKVSDLDPEIIGDTLESIEMDFEEKATNVGFVVKNMDSDINAVDEEIKRLQGVKKSLQSRKQSVIEYLRFHMAECGIQKIECPLFKITRTKPRNIAEIINEDEIPDEFIKVIKSVDKTALLKALKEGPIDGAKIGKSKEGIRIA